MQSITDKTNPAREYQLRRGAREVPIAGMSKDKERLISSSGESFYELACSNLWRSDDADKRDFLYVGTGKHAGGVVLRPVLANVGGHWINVFTGRESSMSIEGQLRRR